MNRFNIYCIFILFISFSHCTYTLSEQSIPCCYFNGTECGFVDEGGDVEWVPSYITPSENQDLSQFEYYEWMQGPIINAPTTAIKQHRLEFPLNKNDVVSIQFYKNSESSSLLLQFIQKSVGLIITMGNATSEGWQLITITCGVDECCLNGKYPCRIQPQIAGNVNQRDDILAFTDFFINDCPVPSTTTTTTSTTTTTPTTTTTTTTTTSTTTDTDPTTEPSTTQRPETSEKTTTVETTANTASVPPSSSVPVPIPTSSSKDVLSIGAIIGICIGGLCAVLLIVLFIMMCIRQRKRKSKAAKNKWTSERQADVETIYSPSRTRLTSDEMSNYTQRQR